MSGVDPATVAAAIPDGLRDAVRGRPAQGGPDGDQWLHELPRLAASLLADWDLTLDGPARHGVCALVLPVRRDAEPLALKVSWPHPEAASEHLVLRAWGGRDSVRLVAADPARSGLLLERLDADRSLAQVDLYEACTTIGELLRSLRHEALPGLDSGGDFLDRMADRLLSDPPPVPRRYLEQGRSLVRSLGQGPTEELVDIDLHYDNVLARPDGQWVVIDPKARNTTRAAAVAPALWNRWAEVAESDVRWMLRWRVDLICEAAGIDAAAARAWTIVRELDNAREAAAEGDRDRVTRAIAIIKAMND